MQRVSYHPEAERFTSRAERLVECSRSVVILELPRSESRELRCDLVPVGARSVPCEIPDRSLDQLRISRFDKQNVPKEGETLASTRVARKPRRRRDSELERLLTIVCD
jgi:hypothetical protein